ncbi:Golgin subfamily A member 7/ERF4 family-domain-containing protein [Butyriboletus roseoflavus]|nr:Golgin subfamily A member 7/ERF4 family-domain-containing protein [Butyriboletus roseoflavus]
MTSLEHVSIEHALSQSSSWSGDGDVVEIRSEVEAEEVSFGLAITTPEDEEEVGIVVVGDEQSPLHTDRNVNEPEHDEDANAHGNGDGERDHVASGVGSSSKPVVAFRRSLALGSASRSRSRSNSNSNSRSRSRSGSQSRSSVREGLEMAESSVATSWTQVDGEGGRRSGSCEVYYCRSSADGTNVREQAVDVGEGENVRTPREGTEVMPLSCLRTDTSVGGGGDVSRKEEVLVVQEEDIGEEWHPLRYNGKARSRDDGEDESKKGEGEGEGEEDVGSVRLLESIHGGDQSLEMSEKGRGRKFGSSGRNARHLHLEFKRPSPQPWDEIDPPGDSNEMYTSDYYSTLNSKRFATLQKSRRRPLIPHSAYYFGPPPPDSAYGTLPVGQIGVHHPREIVRIERDYAGGELIQFSPIFPLELDGRITPTQFHQTINDINEILISAHSIQRTFVDNLLAVVTLQLSTLVMSSHYEKEMRRLKRKIEEMNTGLYNPVGLHILWPQRVAFLFLEIEYYVSLVPSATGDFADVNSL